MIDNSEFRTFKKNTIIIAIANLGSKAIAFILAPLYSYYLSTDQYGVMDLITTAGGLLLPIFCLDIFEATFRYSSDSDYKDKTVLSSSLFVVILEVILLSLSCVIVSFFITIPLYMIVILLCAELDSFFQVLTQFVRGKNHMKEYALSGVVNSVVLLTSNIMLLVLMKKSLDGWIFSFVIAKFFSCIYIVVISRFWKFFSFKNISREFLKRAFAYCLPLLPTTIMWWIMNLSDRFLISVCMGLAGTGIYAVASKIPSLLSVFENVFFQSWQTSAINTVNDDNRESFYSSVFEKYMILLTLGVLGVLTVLKPIITIFSDEYEIAWMSSGILVISVLFHALGGNLGALYAAFKRTKGTFYTSAYGAITNIFLNFLLIPKFGLMAAATTTMIGYIVVLVTRWIDLKKYVNLSINLKNIWICFVLITAQTCAYYMGDMISCLMHIVILIWGCIIYRKEILVFISKN
jgi:O-antigen/teichoic acid export membrane protein